MTFEAYPIICRPILKERIWGGTKLKSVLNKDITSDTIGESWELSTVPESISVISNGAFADITLENLISDFPIEILGSKVHENFGITFPLLFKFIDAHADLSVQVHPNDEIAKRRHNSFGKTEMWYIMQSDPGSRIIVGFKEDSSPDQYLEHLKDNSIVSLLQEIEVQKGDVFLLETGTVHAIGSGIVLAEIQQTSDITYRIYDFDRRDVNGNPRQLHTEEAIEAINYKATDSQKEYSELENQANTLVDCKYFTTNMIPLQGSIKVQKDKTTFTVFMCVAGSFEFIYNSKSAHYQKGDTILIPAQLSAFELRGNASLLEIYIS